jgi:hypothetical protein
LVDAAFAQETLLIRLGATISPRASLVVSDQFLSIPPSAPGDPETRAIGTIRYRAAARTGATGDVLLTVEPLADLSHLGGPASAGVTIGFSGAGDGTVDGVLVERQPSVAARWASSGIREGQLTFSVRGDIGPAGAVVPLRFVLSTP